ncbi:M28 family peptidase [Chloroflexi bacterium TSY]|nr:M28 family peptidase [Chloroflexi bacterium TSY]
MQRFQAYSIEISLVTILLLAVAFFGYLGYGLVVVDSSNRPFSGEQALDYAATQLKFGPRTTGGEESQRMRDWLVEELTSKGWDVVIQPLLTQNETRAQNIIAISKNQEERSLPTLLIGTHYDSRLMADQDEDSSNHSTPSPGANRGASGSAVLLEIARTVNLDETNYRVCLGFFDAGDNGNIDTWDFAEGSRYFITNLQTEIPRCDRLVAAVIIDQVGSAERMIVEQQSNPDLVESLQLATKEVGFDNFLVGEPTSNIDGDHMPFLEHNIPTVYLFDANYPHRHTLSDTLDKLDAENLERVGQLLKVWLENGPVLPQ